MQFLELGGRGSGRTTRSIKIALERVTISIPTRRKKSMPKVRGPISLVKFLLTKLWWWKYPDAAWIDYERPAKVALMCLDMRRADNIKRMIEQHRGEWFDPKAKWVAKYSLLFPNGGKLTLISTSAPGCLLGRRLDSLVKDHDAARFDERLIGHIEHPIFSERDCGDGDAGSWTSYERQAHLSRLGALYRCESDDDPSMDEGGDDSDETRES